MSFNFLSNVKSVWFNSIEFKSMIEARWYCLYSQNNIVAYYEPTSFRLIGDDGVEIYKQYTPDYYLPEQDIYHEVKLSTHPTLTEFRKCYYLAKTVKKNTLITWTEVSTQPRAVMFFPDGSISGKIKFVKCPLCEECGWYESCMELKCEHNIDAPSSLLDSMIKKVITSEFIKS